MQMNEYPRFEFDRYVNGQLMAEGVIIERQPTLEKASEAAAKIASRGPDSEAPVLVLRAYTTALTGDAAGVVERLRDDDLLSTRIEAATLITAQAERIAELERVARLAWGDQAGFLYECRKYANQASDADASRIRHIRADRVEERLKITQDAVAASRKDATHDR